jgi:hypothetical protein
VCGRLARPAPAAQFLLLGYVVYDWWTIRTWWLPWVFAAITALYSFWFFRRLCQSMALKCLHQLISRLRDGGVAPPGDDEASRVLAECLLSQTGRQLMFRLASPGTEPGNVQYSAEATSILAAFAEERRARGDGAELDANTLRWLQVREPLLARLRARFAVPR